MRRPAKALRGCSPSEVRILFSPPYGSLVKRLRHCSFTAITPVRFWYESPILGIRQAVRHGTLTPAFTGSNPVYPAKSGCRVTVTHLLWEQGQAGSTPVIPTTTNKKQKWSTNMLLWRNRQTQGT